MALTTIAAVRAIPGAQESWTDAQITSAIAAAGGMIFAYCDRALEAASYHEWVDADGGKYLHVKQYPIIRVNRVSLGINEALHLTNSSTDATWRQLSVADGTMSLTVVGGANAGTSGLTLAGYATMALLRTAILGLNKGWAVSIDAEGDPPSLKPCFDGSEYQDGILYAYQAGTDVGGYQPQTDKGMLYRQAGWSSEPGYVYVNYRAGYETIPDDLAMIAGSLAMALLRDMATEPRLTSLRIGNVAEGYATGLGGLVEAYAPLLMKYRRLYY